MISWRVIPGLKRILKAKTIAPNQFAQIRPIVGLKLLDAIDSLNASGSKLWNDYRESLRESFEYELHRLFEVVKVPGYDKDRVCHMLQELNTIYRLIMRQEEPNMERPYLASLLRQEKKSDDYMEA